MSPLSLPVLDWTPPKLERKAPNKPCTISHLQDERLLCQLLHSGDLQSTNLSGTGAHSLAVEAPAEMEHTASVSSSRTLCQRLIQLRHDVTFGERQQRSASQTVRDLKFSAQEFAKQQQLEHSELQRFKGGSPEEGTPAQDPIRKTLLSSTPMLASRSIAKPSPSVRRDVPCLRLSRQLWMRSENTGLFDNCGHQDRHLGVCSTVAVASNYGLSDDRFLLQTNRSEETGTSLVTRILACSTHTCAATSHF